MNTTVIDDSMIMIINIYYICGIIIGICLLCIICTFVLVQVCYDINIRFKDPLLLDSDSESCER